MTTGGSPQNECRSPQGYLSDTHTHPHTSQGLAQTWPYLYLIWGEKKWEEMDWGFLQKMPCFFWAQGGFFRETNLEFVYHQISPPPLHCAGSTDFPTTSQMKPMVSVILGAALHIQDYWKEFFLLLHSFVFLFFNVYLFILLSVFHILL